MLSVNSLTVKPPVGRSEYGRVKVALPQGKGLMDWVRLSTSKVLAKRRLPYVDHNELVKHNTAEDCWIHIFGQVYDVSSYLDFHPGGIPELMRAAGRDGTALFNQYHAWVNYESMLKSCLVGRFNGDLTKLPPCGPPTVDETINTSVAPAAINGFQVPQSAGQNVGVNIKIDSNALVISSTEWNSLSSKNVVYELNSQTSLLRVLVRHFMLPSAEIQYGSVNVDLFSAKPSLRVENNKIILQFTGLDENLRQYLDNESRIIRKRPMVKYYSCLIKCIRSISHDTLLFHLETPAGLHLPIPMGHHVSIKAKKGLVATYRPYTPVAYTLPNMDLESGSLTFLIKIYPDGNISPVLQTLKEGDKLEISDPIGDKDILKWIGADDLILLAAGTGITPMIPILEARLEWPEHRTELFFFNRTERDIVADDWAPIRWTDERIKVHHVLSSPTASWKGLFGRINSGHLPTIGETTKVLMCGPDGFIETASSILEAKGVSSQNIHIFQG